MLFKQRLEEPLNICKENVREVMMHSGIKDWETDYAHLQQQMDKSQKGIAIGIDVTQKKRDSRRMEKKVGEETRRFKSIEEVKRMEAACELIGSNSESNPDSDSEWTSPERIKKRKVDVMGKIALTSDRLGISARKRAALAATCINAANIPMADTNISVTSAWRKGRQKRLQQSEKVKTDFTCPEFLVVHWDGKILKVKGGKSSERCCVCIWYQR